MPKKKPTVSERLNTLMEQMLAKLPPNVDVDVVKLSQMALMGTATYMYAKPILKAVFALSVHISTDPEKEGKVPDVLRILYMPGSLYGWMVEEWFGYSPWSGVSYTPEQIDEIRDKIDAFEPTEDQMIVLSLATAAITPMIPEIIKGLGGVIEGIIPF